MSRSKLIRAAITMGDPAGIGAELIVKALAHPAVSNIADFVIIGDKWAFNKAQGACLPAGRQKLRAKNYTFLDLNNVPRENFRFGVNRPEYGRASIEYIDKAAQLLKKRAVDCLVTCPISKEAINSAGFRFPGHTEYLAKLTKAKDFVMMLLNRQLKIVLITRHIPLTKVSSAISKEIILKDILLTYKSLKRLFLIPSPRIVVCGLNPHASDNGLLGTEENNIIKPVLKRLNPLIAHSIDGPFSADVAISRACKNKYDCVVAMYHDQALIPLKLSGSSTGVNITLGLAFVRTSPLHGTAFDIAGRNLADPSSMIESIKLAVRCTLNQRKA